MGNKMKMVKFGRRKFAVAAGKTELVSTSITVRSLVGEDEQSFTERLLEMCGGEEGFIEIVIKSGKPDYAVITFHNV